MCKKGELYVLRIEKNIAIMIAIWKEKYNKGIMKVNGHNYYDIRYALNEYEDRIKEKETQVFNLNSRIRELKDDLEKLNKDFPTLKQAVKEWMEYQKESEV